MTQTIEERIEEINKLHLKTQNSDEDARKAWKEFPKQVYIMMQLIRDMQARIMELSLEKPLYQANDDGSISIIKCKSCGELEGENNRLREAMRNAREVYIGMDGFIPQTTPEGYCLRIIEQMYSELCDKPLLPPKPEEE